jgi:hypothetical protein
MLTHTFVRNFVQGYFFGGAWLEYHGHLRVRARLTPNIISFEMTFNPKAPLPKTDELTILPCEITATQAQIMDGVKQIGFATTVRPRKGYPIGIQGQFTVLFKAEIKDYEAM